MANPLPASVLVRDGDTTVKASPLIELLRQLVDSDPRQREQGADQVTDWINSYSPAESITLATVLSASAAREQSHAALEAQLHAILELASNGQVRVQHIAHLSEIDPGELPATLQEYIADLLEG
ncbi:hypothetical protein [Streptomyces alboflavus]|uniref:hypothetical protein n=1 Tax=Streptomyces alboflavus TaxID=67267 RepID=UPI000F65901A|nr:hypothetical protein [Streptomyces alboflavus]